MNLTIEEVEEIRECHPEGLVECYCDNTHEQNNTVCMYCWLQNDFREAFCKLTRIAVNTDRSQMNPHAHRDFITIIDRAQKIVNLEAQQAGLPDLWTLGSAVAHA